jgi:hypothetical protein
MSSDYRAMMDKLCVGMGWCGSVVDGTARHVSDYIPAAGMVTANQFADWLFEAEGYDPSTGAHAERHRRGIISVFIQHMGGEAVEATRLR